MSVTQEFQQDIVNWIKYDNDIKEINKKVKDLKGKQSLLEDNITHYALNNNMNERDIVVSKLKCSIKCTETEKYDNLSFRLLKDSLEDYFKDQNVNVDEVVKFVKGRRLKKIKTYLKREELNDIED